MSEASPPNPPEKPKRSWKEHFEQGGEFGANRRKREEAAKASEAQEEQVELGIDGEPLADGEQRELYDRIITSKINNPDARLRERASEWGLNYGQRVKMSDGDFRALESEAEREIGRIEARQQADKNTEAAATRESAYQQEMADFRAEGKLSDTLYEAALAQLPEPELTSTDPIERYYEQQQAETARKEEAKRIAGQALEQFKDSRDAAKAPEPNPKKEIDDADHFDDAEETQQVPGTLIDDLDSKRTGDGSDRGDLDSGHLPPPPYRSPDFPDYSVSADETQPVPRNVIDDLDAHRGSDADLEPDYDNVPLRLEKRRDRKILKTADELYDVVQELGEELTDEERALLEEAERILQKAPRKLSPWHRLKEALRGDSEDENSGEKKNRSRLAKMGGAALAAVGIVGVGYLTYKGLATGDELSAISGAPSSEITPSTSIVPEGVDTGGNALPIGNEFSEAAQIAEQREGWWRTISEATGIKNPQQLDTVLKTVGPDLVRMGQAYPAPELGGYGISRPGRISDEALRLINEEARRRGYVG